MHFASLRQLWLIFIFEPEVHIAILQGFQMGIALPQFLLDIDGASGGILLLWIVGVCILLPLVVAVIYLSRSSKYTGNYVMHQTLSAYYYLMKPSLAPRLLFSSQYLVITSLVHKVNILVIEHCRWICHLASVCILSLLLRCLIARLEEFVHCDRIPSAVDHNALTWSQT